LEPGQCFDTEDTPAEQSDVDVIADMIKKYDKSNGWESLKEELMRCSGAGFTGGVTQTDGSNPSVEEGEVLTVSTLTT